MANEARDYLLRQFETAWALTDDLHSTQRTRWPFQDRPFGDVIAWANVELTKSAAEIGYARFLHGARTR